jgi:hypothetical protein
MNNVGISRSRRAAPRPTTAELFDPDEAAETAAWLASLPVRHRLVTPHAMQILFSKLLRKPRRGHELREGSVTDSPRNRIPTIWSG